MNNKVSTSWLTAATDSDFETTAHTIVTALTGSTVFPSPVPALTLINVSLTAFTEALSAAKDGGKSETAAKNAARLVIAERLRELGQYIDDTATSLEDFLLSKYPLRKESTPLSIQPAPANLRLKHGNVSCSVDAVCEKSAHRVLYEWQTAGGQVPADWTIQPSTNSSRTRFSGFTPGTWLNARVRIRVPAGAGDWSGVTQIMVI